jgi:hypothetical protein
MRVGAPTRPALVIWLASLLGTTGCGTDPSPAVPVRPVTSSGPGPAADGPRRGQYFHDITAPVGVTFRHQQRDVTRPRHENSSYAILNLPEVMAPGVALIDVDGDGFHDIFFVQGSGDHGGRDPSTVPRCQLYRGQPDGTYAECSRDAGVDFGSFGMGCLAADVDNDGYTDLCVTAYGQDNALFLSNGDGTFREAAARLGVAGDRRWHSFIGAFDEDGDGLLDLYLGRYANFLEAQWANDPAKVLEVLWGKYSFPKTMTPHPYDGQDKTLFRSRLPAPYRDVTRELGLEDAQGRGLAAIAVDFDGCGRPEVFVSNDVSLNALFKADGRGRYRNVAEIAYVGENRGNMGVAVGDLQHDGRLDLVVTHFYLDPPAMYVNRSKAGAKSPMFVDRAAPAGLVDPVKNADYVGWGTSFVDVNQDGWEDLLIVNGHPGYGKVVGELDAEAAQLFINTGKGTFDSVAPTGGDDPLARLRVARGAAFGDLDHDGATDVIVGVNNGPGEVWKAAGGAGRWLAIRIVGTSVNRDALGSLVRLESPRRAHLKALIAGESYFSSNARELSYGLGSDPGPFGARVRWPSGRVESFDRLSPLVVHALVEGTGTPAAWTTVPRP